MILCPDRIRSTNCGTVMRCRSTCNAACACHNVKGGGEVPHTCSTLVPHLAWARAAKVWDRSTAPQCGMANTELVRPQRAASFLLQGTGLPPGSTTAHGRFLRRFAKLGHDLQSCSGTSPAASFVGPLALGGHTGAVQTCKICCAPPACPCVGVNVGLAHSMGVRC